MRANTDFAIEPIEPMNANRKVAAFNRMQPREGGA
jgi:hypothetical protein